MTPYFRERLPILDAAEDHIVSRNGDITMAYKVVKPEVFGKSSAELNAASHIVTKALQVLSPGSIVHFQDIYWQTKWQGDFDNPAMSFLSGCSDRHYHERTVINHHCYLFITRRPARRAVSAGSALLSKNLVPQDTLSTYAVQEFNAQGSQFVQILKDGWLTQCRQIPTEELASTPEKVGLIEQYCQLIMPGEIPELRDLHFELPMRIGRKHILLHSIADAEHLPAQLSPTLDHAPYSTDRTPFSIGAAAPLGYLLPHNHIYNQFIFIEDATKVRKKLESKRRRMHQLSSHSRENALGRDAVDAYLDESVAGGKLVVRAHFNIISWTDDVDAVERLRDRTSAAIAKLGATPHLETVGGPQLWCAGIPGNAADMHIDDSFLTLAEQAVCLLTPDTSYRNNGETGLRLGDRPYGRPLQIDLSEGPMKTGVITNRNKFVLGGSGSGKSFFTNHLMRSYYDSGAHILIIDIGNSYKGLCELSDGYYFTYTDTEPLCLNPFWLRPGETPDVEKRESLKTLLLAIWKKEDEAFLRSEYVTLSNALQLYYEQLAANPGIFPCFDSFYEFLLEEFAGLLAADKIKTRDFDIDNFLYVLRPFYKGGEYDFLLNAREQLDLLYQRFIVFELDTIKDHPILFPVVTIVIMDVFIGKMRRLPGFRKVINIEEAWKPIARQGMGEYMKFLLKALRKYYGEAIVVTQEVEDLISSPVVKQAILNNTDCKILLDQSKFRNRFEEIQRVLGLSEKDKELVLSLNQDRDPKRKYKEVFISLGSNNSQVYQVEVSTEEYLTYTTEEKEKLQVQEWSRKHGSLEKGIAALAAALRDGSLKWLLIALMLFSPFQRTKAQFPIADIIQMAVKKVIIATDLAIQRLQTETIGLQNAQKVLENAMQLQRLTDIADWVRHQKDLFAGYYQELWQVKNTVTLYYRTRDIIGQQAALIAAYKRSWSSIREDPHFSAEELENMGKVYSGILEQGIRQVGELEKVITAFVTQMEDGGRLAIIDRLGEEMDQNRRDLLAFTQENVLISLQRSKSQNEIKFIQSLYNIHL